MVAEPDEEARRTGSPEGEGIKKGETSRNPSPPPRHSSPGPELGTAAAAATLAHGTREQLLLEMGAVTTENDLDRRFHIQRARFPLGIS